MQANKIGPIALKSKSQAVNQYEAYMNSFISPHTIAERSSSQIQLEGGYLQGYLYPPAIIQMIIGTILIQGRLLPSKVISINKDSCYNCNLSKIYTARLGTQRHNVLLNRGDKQDI